MKELLKEKKINLTEQPKMPIFFGIEALLQNSKLEINYEALENIIAFAFSSDKNEVVNFNFRRIMVRRFVFLFIN